MTLPPRLEIEVASGDTLHTRQFSIHERLSSLFTVSLVAVSENPDIAFDDVVGQAGRFTLRSGPHTRAWSGLCSHLQQVRAEESGLSTYELTIVPSLWLLSQRRNYRMFQQIAEPDIVKKLLAEWRIEPEVRLSGIYKPRKYRVQYGESDYAFMSRMLEDAGISFRFQEEDGETKLLLTDAPQSNEPREEKIAYRDNPTVARDLEHVTAVRIGQRVRPGRYTMRDHDYRRPPSHKLITSAEAPNRGVEAKLERYHYTPGAFLFRAERGEDTPVADSKGKVRADEKEGEILARKRLEAKRAVAKVCAFETNAHDLAPGVVMSMVDHPRSDLAPERPYLILESTLSGTHDGEWAHRCEAVSAEIPYRPALATPKPKVNGVESATVVGTPGEEIDCDEFGRVRVHFHWDRESQMDDNSSCWIHVSQAWGGAGFGGMNLPRVGQEVLVDFLGGDPDQPIIVGRVYTGVQRVPFKLPANKTQSGIKSNSTGGGGGYNELMFEDAAGRELLRMQAERDLQKLVKNDEKVTIGNDRAKDVGRDDNQSVGRDRARSVGRDESVSIGRDLNQNVAGNMSLTVGAEYTKIVGENEQETTALHRSIVVGLNRSSSVGLVDSTSVGERFFVAVTPPGGEAGSATSATMVDKKIVFTTGAGATITLEGAEVRIDADVIKLTAKKTIEADAESESVSIRAKTDIALESDQTLHASTAAGVIKLEATGGDLQLGTDQSITAAASVNIEMSSTNATISAPITTINAGHAIISASEVATVSAGKQAAVTSQVALLSGSSAVAVAGGVATVSGASATEVTSGGQVLIQGAPVNINP
jgi:type VI secretion system secreted protein VgrG